MPFDLPFTIIFFPQNRTQTLVYMYSDQVALSTIVNFGLSLKWLFSTFTWASLYGSLQVRLRAELNPQTHSRPGKVLNSFII